MSVVGFDVGNLSSYIGVARKGGIDLVLNSVSSRLNDTLVSFSGDERLLCERAANQVIMNAKNTVSQFRRLIGKKFNDPELQEDMKRFPFKLKEIDNGDVGVEVDYQGERHVFTPVRLMGMILGQLARTAEAANDGLKLADCVVSVPPFYTNEQRLAMLDACKIGGVNCLRLMNDNCAAALAFGIYRNNELPETEPLNVAFVDMGHSALVVSIVAFTKGKLVVKSVAYDRNLGGRDLDYYLADHFAAEIKKKYGIDVSENRKAQIRLVQGCEKLKKLLSSNPEGNLNIESLMNDIDVAFKYSRAEFEELCAPVFSRVRAPIEKALADSGLPVEQIGAVEIIGGGCRIPYVQETLKSVFNKELSKVLNMDEAVARGCALQAAMMSPLFKVREFAVNDISLFPISIVWRSLESSDAASGQGMDVDTKETTADAIFTANNAIPSTKLITFKRRTQSAYELSVFYEKPSMLPPGANTHIGKFFVVNIPPNSNKDSKDPVSVKVKVRLDVHGIVGVSSATMLEDVEYWEEVEAEPVKPKADPKKEKGNGKQEQKDGEKDKEQPASDPMDTSEDGPGANANGEEAAKAEGGDSAKAPEKKKEKVLKKKTKRIDLQVDSKTFNLDSKTLQTFVEKELEMNCKDRLIQQTAEARNSVESYVYDTRSALQSSWTGFTTPEVQESFLAALNKAEDWLYDEGEDATKSVYIAKLEELQAVGHPILFRYKEDQELPIAIDELKKGVEQVKALANSKEEKYAHIEQEDRDKVLAECDKALKWAEEKAAEQAKLPKHADRVVTSAEVRAKIPYLENFARPIMHKPKPKPKEEPKPEPPKEDAKDAKKEGDAPDASEADEPTKSEEESKMDCEEDK